MNAKRLVSALAGVMVLAAISASGAGAEAVTVPSRWYIAGVGLNKEQTAKVSCEVGEHNGAKKLVLTGEIGEGPTIPVKITATGIECIGEAGNANGEAEIVQLETTGPYFAQDRGRLKLTGVTVSEPANCVAEGGAITTNALKSELYMDRAQEKITFDEFEPKAGAGANLATIKILNKEAGKTCIAAGTRALKGAFFGTAEFGGFFTATGEERIDQPLEFSSFVELTTESTASLTLGGNAAHLTGTVHTKLAGANAGKKWGAEEK